MPTTLTIDERVATQLRALAKETNRSLTEVTNEVLLRGLEAKDPPSRPFQVHSSSLGSRTGYQLDNVTDLLEQVDGTRHR